MEGLIIGGSVCEARGGRTRPVLDGCVGVVGVSNGADGDSNDGERGGSGSGTSPFVVRCMVLDIGSEDKRGKVAVGDCV